MTKKTRPHFSNNRALGADSPGKNAPEPTVVYGTLAEALIGIAQDEAAKAQQPEPTIVPDPDRYDGVPEGAVVAKVHCRCGWRGESIEAFNKHDCKARGDQ